MTPRPARPRRRVIRAPRVRADVATPPSGARSEGQGDDRGLGRLLRHLDRPRPDVLTGLGTRAVLATRAPQLLARAAAERRSLTLLVLDLDGFKQLNDTVGHHLGDHVLVETAARLRACGSADLVVRLGGDEFAVLTTPHAAGEVAVDVARRLSAALREPIQVDDLQVSVGVSIGLAVSGTDGETPEELLRAADQAMYDAKAHGPGGWRSATSPGPDCPVSARRLIRDLSRPTIGEELVIHYQPQVGCDGDIVGFEALTRWQHRELGLLAPPSFIPLAERSGLMEPITFAVLDRALADLSHLHRRAPGARLGINITRRHVLGRDFLTVLVAGLARHDVDPAHVVLELTEPLTASTPATAAFFTGLRARDIAVAVQGFGTSRSSLTGLWSNPAVREVKLAPTVLHAAREPNGREGTRLACALVGAAHGLGLRVVAEGAERPADLAFARSLGVDAVQGFGVAAPAPLDVVLDWSGERTAERSHDAGS